jgi:3-methyladenine DNA glycosylase AlkD
LLQRRDRRLTERIAPPGARGQDEDMKTSPSSTDSGRCVRGRNRLRQLHRAVVRALEKLADPITAARDQRFHRNEDFTSYGIRNADLRELLRGFRSCFRQLSFFERLRLAERLLRSGINEEAGVAVFLLAISHSELKPEHFHHLDGFLEQFHSWATTDDFCINVLQPLLLQHREEVLDLLVTWSASENRWKRRASVVAFVRKIGASGDFTAVALQRCDALKWDQDDLVRKGVGWALKDVMRGEREPVIDFVRELRRQGVSSTITLYAVRDLEGEERDRVLAIRSEGA